MEEEKKLYCTFCGEEIKDKKELAYTEDAETCHQKCLDSFIQHWRDRDDAIDLMGW